MTQELPVRILIVDDDEPTRRLLCAAMATEKNYETIAASSGSEALQLYRESPRFDLIVTDLTMPHVSGFELIGQLHHLGNTAPILILSAMQSDKSMASALESGAHDYLQKPVDLRELRKAVADLISQHRSAASTGKKHVSRRMQALAQKSSGVRSVEEGTFVELILQGDSPEADRFKRFAERLTAASLGEQDRADLNTALEEITRNAIEWGNRNDPKKSLRLSYCILADRITFRVEDEGAGFDPEELKDPSADPQQHLEDRRSAGKRIGGWGVFLVRKMVDTITYNSKGNVVFLTKFLRSAQAPAAPSVDAEAASRSTRVTRRKTSQFRHKPL